MIVSLFAVCVLRHSWFALRGYLVSGLQITIRPGRVPNAQLLADISARASARLDAGPFFLGVTKLGFDFALYGV